MLILATTFVQLFKVLILATIFVKLFKLFSAKALCAWVNVFYCFCRNAKLLFDLNDYQKFSQVLP